MKILPWATAALVCTLASCARAPAAEVSQNAKASPTAVNSGGSAIASTSAASSASTTPVTSAQAAGSSAPSIPKNLDVILITIDCLRADMPWAGYERAIAPNLTAFAAKSVQYTHE